VQTIMIRKGRTWVFRHEMESYVRERKCHCRFNSTGVCPV
jgi:hypothetical protein